MTTSGGSSGRSPDVSLGFHGDRGFAPTDLTSPAAAAAAGALPDLQFTTTDLALANPDVASASAVTELRVHGVSGSTGPAMLEHPNVLQVAGDSTTMFYRRWSPDGAAASNAPGAPVSHSNSTASVPRRLEAYSWGGLTEKPLASAVWVLLAPFMLFNVAHFALPAQPHRIQEQPGRLTRTRGRGSAAALLRVAALTGSIQFAVVIATVFVNIVGYQARRARFPSWLKWYPDLGVHARVQLGLVLCVGVLAFLWLISVKTETKYESRVTAADAPLQQGWAMTQARFWHGRELVRRQRNLHSAAAMATLAIVMARPGHSMGAARTAVVLAAAALGAAVLVTLWSRIADRWTITLSDDAQRSRGALWWCRALFIAATTDVVASSWTGGWVDPSGPATVRGLSATATIVLMAQGVTLVLFAAVVLVLHLVWRSAQPRAAGPTHAVRRWSAADETRPFLRGQLATLLAVLAVSLGGALSALVTVILGRVFGAPVPSGPDAGISHALQIPWGIYAMVAAPAGLIAGLAVGVAWALWLAHRDAKLFLSVEADPAPEWRVTGYYGLDEQAARERGSAMRAVASWWARARLVDSAAVIFGCAAAGIVVAVLALVIEIRVRAGSTLPPAFHGAATLLSSFGLVVAGGLVTLVRSVYADPSRRKTIGALWDVGTFWPRATHPFAPPCYAERAVPELVDRIRTLTGTSAAGGPGEQAGDQVGQPGPPLAKPPSVPSGPVLLTGYSQGSVIAPAVVAQLPAATAERVALLTLACPARRLYGRAFPGYFGGSALSTLAAMLTEPGTTAPESTRWRNVVRRTDYIGSWIVADPAPAFAPSDLASRLDQPCPDPVRVAADTEQTKAPIHTHLAFFSDPFVAPVAARLGDSLRGR